MRFKKDIIKRGVKDTTWLDNFIKSNLKENNITKINYCTEKMLYAISKTARYLSYYITKNTTRSGLFYYNSRTNLALEQIEDVNGRKFIYCYNVEKFVNDKCKNRVQDFLKELKEDSLLEKATKEEVEKIKELITLDTKENENVFSANFTKTETTKIYKELTNDFILKENKIEIDLEDR